MHQRPSTQLHRYFQAGWAAAGHAKESATGCLFVRGVNTAHVGPRAIRDGLIGESYAPAAAVATGANVGVLGPVVAQKKAVAGRGLT